MVKAILKMFSLIPLRVNHLIGEGLGRLLYIINSKSKQIQKKILQSASQI